MSQTKSLPPQTKGSVKGKTSAAPTPRRATGQPTGALMADLKGQLAAIDKSLAVIEFELDGRVRTANANFLATMGYSLDEIQGRHHGLFVEQACREGLEYRLFWDKLGRGEYDSGVYKRIAKSGREVWLQASYNPILDAHGKAFKIVKYASDITAEKLRAANFEGQLNAVNKSFAVIEFGLDGSILSANDNFLKTVGYTLDEIKGKHHGIFVDAQFRESLEYRLFWEKLARGEHDAGQYPRIGKNGRRLWLQASYNPIFDLNDKPYKVVKYASDVTEQKRRSDLKQALDVAATNVMVADPDYNIIYGNQSLNQMLAEAEHDIRTQLPQFSAKDLLGTNIDVFHKNPAHQRRMLDDLKTVHKTKLLIGGRSFDLIVNPIVDDNGGRIGTVVEWKDMTATLAAQQRADQLAAENQRIKQALDVAATNVMLADPDYNIIYGNLSLSKMLAEAESDIRKQLPNFSARDLIGTNIDVFHKNPAHQRGMLGHLKTTHTTKLTIGGRTFDLIVNPIIDAKGTRLGTVVEWKDMTAILAAREREERLAAENLRIKNALDKCTTNVMIADANNDIVYMNESVGAMMARNETELRKVLPQFDSRRLIKASIDMFHKNPRHQQNMLANLRGTYQTEIKVSGLTFGLVANPIVADNGERVGTVVEWKDRTQEVAVEQEVAGIVNAAAQGDFSKRFELAGKEGFFKQLGEGVNQLMNTSSAGLEEVVRVLGALAQGDLTETIENDYAGTFGQLKDDSNATVEQLTAIITQIREATDAINTAAVQIANGNTDLSQRRGAGFEPRTDGVEHGAADRDGEAERRQRAPGQPARGDRIGSRAEGRRRGLAGGDHDELDHRKLEEDRRHHQRDRRHRLPDQHPRAERRRGSGACR